MSCLFCLPAYGMWVSAHFTKSLVQLVRSLEQSDFRYDMTFGADSGVHRTRYRLAETFMRSDFDRLMFIDADIEFTPEDFGKLWALDADVAVGVYRMNDGEPWAAHVGGRLVTDLDQYSEPVPVDYAGTGFMLIKRHVFEGIRDQLLDIEVRDLGTIKRWFDFPVVQQPDGRSVELPEDYAFCHRARQAGFSVVMDPSVRLTHWKQKGC